MGGGTETGGKKKRRIIVSLNKITDYIISTLSDESIYVYLSSEGKKIRADASSESLFEIPNNYIFASQVWDSNFRNGKEIMHYEDFIDVLARLNNGQVIDHTLEEGISAVKRLDTL